MRRMSRQTLAEVVEPRYEELFSLVQAELRRSGYERQIVAGIVLTGGSSNMQGVVELAEEVFHVPVRVGTPQYVKGLVELIKNPIYATGVGLLLYGLRQQQDRTPFTAFTAGRQCLERMKSWFQVGLEIKIPEENKSLNLSRRKSAA